MNYYEVIVSLDVKSQSQLAVTGFMYCIVCTFNTRGGASLMVCFCRTASLSSTLCTYCVLLPLLRVHTEVQNWMEVCHHTFCLLITQISFYDSIPWQDSWDVLCRKWIGLAQKKLFERKPLECLFYINLFIKPECCAFIILKAILWRATSVM